MFYDRRFAIMSRPLLPRDLLIFTMSEDQTDFGFGRTLFAIRLSTIWVG